MNRAERNIEHVYKLIKSQKDGLTLDELWEAKPRSTYYAIADLLLKGRVMSVWTWEDGQDWPRSCYVARENIDQSGPVCQ